MNVSLSFVSHRSMISHLMDLMLESDGHNSSMKASSLSAIKDLVLYVKMLRSPLRGCFDDILEECWGWAVWFGRVSN